MVEINVDSDDDNSDWIKFVEKKNREEKRKREQEESSDKDK